MKLTPPEGVKLYPSDVWNVQLVPPPWWKRWPWSEWPSAKLTVTVDGKGFAHVEAEETALAAGPRAVSRSNGTDARTT